MNEDQLQTSKHAHSEKQFDLESVMSLLKTYNVPKHLEPMQNVVYSTVQMFGASWLATTQSLSTQFQDFQKQTEYIRKLEEKIDNLEIKLNTKTETTNTAESDKEMKFVLDSLQEQQTTMIEEFESVRNQISEIKNKYETTLTTNNIVTVQNSDKNEVNTNPSSKDTTDMNEDLVAIQNILHVHGKKISELIKRYKRHHNDINTIKQTQDQFNTQTQKLIQQELTKFKSNLQNDITNIVNENLKTLNLNSSPKQHSSHKLTNIADSEGILEKINKLESMTVSELEQFKDNLASHEMEHEGIINQILQDMTELKENTTVMINENTGKSSLTQDLSLIDAKIDAKISPMQEELEIFVNDKTTRLIATVKKIMSDMTHNNLLAAGGSNSKKKGDTSHSPKHSVSNNHKKSKLGSKHAHVSQTHQPEILQYKHNRSSSMYQPNPDVVQAYAPHSSRNANISPINPKNRLHSPEKSMRSKRGRSTSFDMQGGFSGRPQTSGRH